MDSPHKGPGMQKVFKGHDVIMKKNDTDVRYSYVSVFYEQQLATADIWYRQR